MWKNCLRHSNNFCSGTLKRWSRYEKNFVTENEVEGRKKEQQWFPSWTMCLYTPNIFEQNSIDIFLCFCASPKPPSIQLNASLQSITSWNPINLINRQRRKKERKVLANFSTENTFYSLFCEEETWHRGWNHVWNFLLLISNLIQKKISFVFDVIREEISLGLTLQE